MSVQPVHNLSLEEMDKQSFLHPYTALKDHNVSGPKISGLPGPYGCGLRCNILYGGRSNLNRVNCCKRLTGLGCRAWTVVPVRASTYLPDSGTIL